MKRLNFDVDDEFHAKLKAYCARRGVDMKEEVVELVSLALEAQAELSGEQEGGEAYGAETVEPEGEGKEPESGWRDSFKPPPSRESARSPFVGKTGEGENSGDINERLRKIEATTKDLGEYVISFAEHVKAITEKLKQVTETVEHIEKWLKETHHGEI